MFGSKILFIQLLHLLQDRYRQLLHSLVIDVLLDILTSKMKIFNTKYILRNEALHIDFAFLLDSKVKSIVDIYFLQIIAVGNV